MMRSALPIARVAFLDSTRAPAYGALLAVALLVEALAPALAMFGFGQEDALLKEFSVSTVLLVAVVLAGLSASTVAHAELRSGAGEALFAKPVSRGAWVAGKFGGLAAAWTLAAYLLALAVLLAARQGPPKRAGEPWDGPVAVGALSACALAAAIAIPAGLRSSRPFGQAALFAFAPCLTAGFLLPATFDAQWRFRPFAPGFDPELLGALLIAYLAGILLVSVALLSAILFGRGALLATALAFLGGLAWGGIDSPWLSWLPSLQAFWVGDVFYRPGLGVGPGLLLYAAVYTASYSLVCGVVGTWALGRREVSAAAD